MHPAMKETLVADLLQMYNPHVAQLSLMVQQIRAYEKLPLDEQTRLRDLQLHVLLCHAWKFSSFWRQRLVQAGFDPACADSGVFLRLPPLMRTDLQNSREAVRARWPGLNDAQISVNTSSGSTGQPVQVEVASTIYEPIYNATDWVHGMWLQRDGNKKLAILSAGAINEDLRSWGGLHELAGMQGVCARRNLGARPMSAHLDWLCEEKPDYLKCSPFVAAELAQSALDTKVQLPIWHILSQFERVTPRQRALCQQAFGARIIDRYSCEEVGWMAMQCPKHDHLHVMNASVYIEIVDEQGAACPPGKMGRVLVTSLHSYAMPIIRYDIGDLAEWGEPCDCGLTSPVIARLWGRRRHLARLPSGGEFAMPHLGDDLGKIEPIREFRIRQYLGAEIEIQISATRALSESEIAEAKNVFTLNGLPGLPVFVTEVPSIDWTPGRKREEFVRLDEPWPGPSGSKGSGSI